MRAIEDELRALYPLDWQPSSMRPAGFELFTAGMALRGIVTVQGARAGAVLVVKAEVAPASVRHYFVCYSDSHGAERVTSGPDLADELRRAAQMDAGIRAALTAKPKRDDTARMRVVMERCVKVLQEVQWSGIELDKYGQSQGEMCPSCGDSAFRVHFDGCELAACIRDGRELLEAL